MQQTLGKRITERLKKLEKEKVEFFNLLQEIKEKLENHTNELEFIFEHTLSEEVIVRLEQWLHNEDIPRYRNNERQTISYGVSNDLNPKSLFIFIDS